MTATAHLQLTDAVMSVLNAPPAVFQRLTRGRAVPAQLGNDNAGFVRLHTAKGQRLDMAGLTTQWHTAIVVEIAARATAAQDAHEAVDALLQTAFSRIAASTPEAGAWEWAGEPEIQWQIDEADTTVGLAALVLPIRHLTGPHSLSPAP